MPAPDGPTVPFRAYAAPHTPTADQDVAVRVFGHGEATCAPGGREPPFTPAVSAAKLCAVSHGVSCSRTKSERLGVKSPRNVRRASQLFYRRPASTRFGWVLPEQV